MGNCNKSQKEEFLKTQNEKLESQLEKAEVENKALKLEQEKQAKTQMEKLVKECVLSLKKHYLANTREASTETTAEVLDAGACLDALVAGRAVHQ